MLSDKSEGNTKRIFRVDKTGQVEGLSEYESEKILCPVEK